VLRVRGLEVKLEDLGFKVERFRGFKVEDLGF
jgi:hypothetical protein